MPDKSPRGIQTCPDHRICPFAPHIHQAPCKPRRAQSCLAVPLTVRSPSALHVQASTVLPALPTQTFRFGAVSGWLLLGPRDPTGKTQSRLNSTLRNWVGNSQLPGVLLAQTPPSTET